MHLNNLFNESIVKKGSKYVVKAESGREMGTYDSKEKANKRLRQIEMFKHMAESINITEAEADIEVEVPGIGRYTADTLGNNIIGSIEKLHQAAQEGNWEQVEYSLDPNKMGGTLLVKAKALVQALKQNRMLEGTATGTMDYVKKHPIKATGKGLVKSLGPLAAGVDTIAARDAYKQGDIETAKEIMQGVPLWLMGLTPGVAYELANTDFGKKAGKQLQKQKEIQKQKYPQAGDKADQVLESDTFIKNLLDYTDTLDTIEVDVLGEAGKDACYHKVKSRYKVWPSAYASGALVQCRKKGAKNWGNKSKKK